jgi:putative DNA primase/helicase
MPNPAVSRILDRLAQVKVSGAGWQARCPAHDDHTPSLHIAEGAAGRALLTCHAGCTVVSVLAALGLTVSDIGPESSGPAAMAETARYRYVDEQGTHLYDVVRYNPKTFRQQRADGAWSMAHVRRVLYHLDQVHAAPAEAVVYVVEGEKDADALATRGLVATTNVGGAGKWRWDYTEQLRSANVRKVVVLQDNDEAGRHHAEQVAKACRAAEIEARVLLLPGLPPKGDVSDWLAQGHTVDELSVLVDRESDKGRRRLQLTPASAIQPRPVQYLWDGRLALGTLALLGGREGIGKSLVGYTLAADVTKGRLPGAYLHTPKA